jgi:hypothetical protein
MPDTEKGGYQIASYDNADAEMLAEAVRRIASTAYANRGNG